MPQLFRFGEYIIYFWVNEGEPPEPIHVHIAKGRPIPNATKIWITSRHKCLLANNNSQIPTSRLNKLMRFVEANINTVINVWKEKIQTEEYYV